MEFCRFVLKILIGNENLAYINGNNSGRNVRKLMCNNHKLDVMNVNAYIQFGEIMSTCSQDIEWKQNLNEILTSINGHNSGTNA